MGWDTKLIGRAMTIALPMIMLRAGSGVAQPGGAVQARVDNDGLNFWLRPAQRSDGEYTSGVRLTTELGRAPWWRRLVPRSPPCADVSEDHPRCSSATFTVGQEIYTPAEDSQPYTYDGWRTQRPYAGWLFGTLAMRSVRRSTERAVGVTLGVTGPPSLAERAQREAHRVMWQYTTQPAGWDTQLRFEPGVVVSAQQRWMLFSGRVKGVRFFDAIVGVGAEAGNVTTNAEATADLRAGLNLSHPWRRARRRGPAEFVVTIGTRGEINARNIFLDGNTLSPDRRVRASRAIRDVRGAVGLRLGAFVISYAVTERSQEYATGPRSHTFGSVIVGIGGIPAVP